MAQRIYSKMKQTQNHKKLVKKEVKYLRDTTENQWKVEVKAIHNHKGNPN